MKKLSKCPGCNAKPKHWAVQVKCEKCENLVWVNIDPNVLTEQKGYVKVVGSAVKDAAAMKSLKAAFKKKK